MRAPVDLCVKNLSTKLRLKDCVDQGLGPVASECLPGLQNIQAINFQLCSEDLRGFAIIFGHGKGAMQYLGACSNQEPEVSDNFYSKVAGAPETLQSPLFQ